MQKYFTLYLLILLLITFRVKAQTQNSDYSETITLKHHYYSFQTLSNQSSSFNEHGFGNLKGLRLEDDYSKQHGVTRHNPLTDSLDYSYVSWETEPRFWSAAGELAIVQFIPFAMARWVRTWENPEDNWAKVSFDSWWKNISYGWEYDGDAFLTNYFSHPYHGNLYYNVGRTNGYNFWESSVWAATGSLLWEYFGETYRPSINDWVNTSMNGIVLGEILFRLSNMLTDNTANGVNRVLREIGGTVLNPVRGFNRLISGETSRLFPNPPDRKPTEYFVTVDAGVRSLDKDAKGNTLLKENVQEGLFVIDFFYGNIFKESIYKPFSAFQLTLALSSGSPSLTRIQAYGSLLGFYLQKKKNIQHLLLATLDYNYLNNPGFIYGGTSVASHLISSFKIGSDTRIVSNVAIDFIAMGATPNDYYTDPEGRNYDFGPGIGINLNAAIQNYIWNLVEILYTSKWLYTQSEPAESRHHMHLILVSGQLPIKKYFAVGIGIGAYWRNSYYDEFDEVKMSSPIFRIFFKTALHY